MDGVDKKLAMNEEPTTLIIQRYLNAVHASAAVL
jgi:hypothetical protein